MVNPPGRRWPPDRGTRFRRCHRYCARTAIGALVLRSFGHDLRTYLAGVLGLMQYRSWPQTAQTARRYFVVEPRTINSRWDHLGITVVAKGALEKVASSAGINGDHVAG